MQEEYNTKYQELNTLCSLLNFDTHSTNFAQLKRTLSDKSLVSLDILKELFKNPHTWFRILVFNRPGMKTVMLEIDIFPMHSTEFFSMVEVWREKAKGTKSPAFISAGHEKIFINKNYMVNKYEKRNMENLKNISSIINYKICIDYDK